jgi:hypothetical protein
MALYQAQSERLEALGRQIPGGVVRVVPISKVWMNVAAGLAKSPNRLAAGPCRCVHSCGEELKGAVQVLRSTDIPNEAADVLSMDFRRQVVKAVSAVAKEEAGLSNLGWLPTGGLMRHRQFCRWWLGLYIDNEAECKTLLEVLYPHRTPEIRFREPAIRRCARRAWESRSPASLRRPNY